VYSWMRPPRRSRRSMPGTDERITRSFGAVGAGGVRLE
jgi:hypothetical protein